MLDSIPQYAILFVIITVLLAVALTVVTSVQQTQCTGTGMLLNGSRCMFSADGGVTTNYSTMGGSYAWNASQGGITSLTTLSSWENNWAIILSAGIVIALIGTFMMLRRQD